VLEWIAAVFDHFDEWWLVLTGLWNITITCCMLFSRQAICVIVPPTVLFPFQLCFTALSNMPTFFIFVVRDCIWY
jgi:hypothetical protein